MSQIINIKPCPIEKKESVISICVKGRIVYAYYPSLVSDHNRTTDIRWYLIPAIVYVALRPCSVWEQQLANKIEMYMFSTNCVNSEYKTINIILAPKFLVFQILS